MIQRRSKSQDVGAFHVEGGGDGLVVAEVVLHDEEGDALWDIELYLLIIRKNYAARRNICV